MAYSDGATLASGRHSWAVVNYELYERYRPTVAVDHLLADSFEQLLADSFEQLLADSFELAYIPEIGDDVSITLRSVGQTEQGAVE